MYYVKDPLAKERAAMEALSRGDKVLAKRLVDEMIASDKEATRRLLFSLR